MEDWSYLRAKLLFREITHLLKGYLSFNQPDIGHFNSVVKQTSLEQLIEGLFEYKTPAYSTWNKEDWLCEECLEKFVREHLHIWYVDQKVKRELLPYFHKMLIHSMLHRRTHDCRELLVRV